MTNDKRSLVPTVSFPHMVYTSMLLAVVVACATPQSEATACDVTSLRDLISEPLSYDGKSFCGFVYARNDRGVVIATENPAEEVSNDLVVILELTQSEISRIRPLPQRYYIRSIINPLEQCFLAADSATERTSQEQCVPFRRPVFLRVTEIRATR